MVSNEQALLWLQKGVIFAHTDIPTGMDLGAALPHQDVAADYVLTAKFLYAQSCDWLSRPFREEPPPFLCAIIPTPFQSIRSTDECIAADGRSLPIRCFGRYLKTRILRPLKWLRTVAWTLAPLTTGGPR